MNAYVILNAAMTAIGRAAATLPSVLLTTIDPPIKGGALTDGVNDLNDILTNIMTWVGAVVLAYGVIQLIMSLSDGNPGTSSRATLTISGGICMLSLSLIIETLSIDENITASTMAANALTVVGNGATYAGAILAAVAMFQFFLAFAGQQGGEAAQASRLLGTSVGLLAGGKIAEVIGDAATATSSGSGGEITTGQTASWWASYVVVRIIGPVATYIGAGLLIHGVVSVILALRSEEPVGWTSAGLKIMTGIALCSIVPILTGVLGITTDFSGY